MNIEEFKPYFDINSHGVGVVARAYQEERNGADISLRVVHAEKYGVSRIGGDNWEYNKHSNSEKEATVHAFELAEDGFDVIIWISPKSDIYEEGRLNVMLPNRDNDELSFDPWGVPLPLGGEDSMKLANRLIEVGGLSMDSINDEESLRQQPIGFRLDEGETWFDRCRKLIPEMIDIWDEIENGNVDRTMEKIVEQVKIAREVARGDNVIFEIEMISRGYRLNVAGDHGGSWLSTLEGKGIYNYKIEKAGNEFVTEKIEVNGKLICPLCGLEISEGATSCSKCGISLKNKAQN
ncbi:MAG: zinc ribbon domain-containing protein [Candidatus Shapirobacteria bacterium]